MRKLVYYIALLTHPFIFGQFDAMVHIEGGTYLPLYGSDKMIQVNDFSMDVYPVTNQEFLTFVQENPEWKKSEVKALFADNAYLQTWKNDSSLPENILPNAPVTNVSWYAAKRYCECEGKRLPTLSEWEYVARANEKMPNAEDEDAFNQYILDWYKTPNTFNKPVGSTFANYWGVHDLHGLVWEWTLDFNTVLMTGESRSGGNNNSNSFCGAAAVGANDLRNYAAFMRFAFRGSLEARYTIKNLGFRCVKDLETTTF